MSGARATVAGVVSALLVAGCGGGGDSSSTHAPTSADLDKLALSAEVALDCLSPNGVDETKLQNDVDVLIREFRAIGPDRRFKLVPTGPNVTMRKLMTNARDALQACAQAGRVGSAGQSLVDRINTELDRAP